MSILVDSTTRIVIQGITGRIGRFSARDLEAYGTKVVAGVAPGRAGLDVEGVPVFSDVRTACEETAADTALVYVPAPAALDAVAEAVESGCRLVVYPGDGLPVQDAIEIRTMARARGVTLVGPNTPGVISPGKAKVGFMPSFCYREGPVAIVSRSGSLSYEVAHRLTTAGIGQSTAVGIGGDPVKGLTAGEALDRLDADAQTEVIVYLGEIGGNDEHEVAAYASREGAKPIIALIVGRSAPAGKKMGHAAALIGSYAETQEAKVRMLQDAGARVVVKLGDVAPAVAAALAAVTPDDRGSR